MISTAHLIGYLGVMFIIASFQFDDRKKILGLQVVSAGVYAIHFFILGAMTGAFMAFFTMIRNAIFIQRPTKKWAASNAWPIAFIAIYMVGGLLTWQGPISLLPMVGMVLGTISRWAITEKGVRHLSLTPSPFWLFYDYMVGSTPAMIGETFIMISNLVGITRYEILHKAHAKSHIH